MLENTVLLEVVQPLFGRGGCELVYVIVSDIMIDDLVSQLKKQCLQIQRAEVAASSIYMAAMRLSCVASS